MTSPAEPRVVPCGDQAVSVEFAEEISREVNARVLALDWLIQQEPPAGVLETVPTFRALLVYYDPFAVGFDALADALRALSRRARFNCTTTSGIMIRKVAPQSLSINAIWPPCA